ncbi:hypothetical protein [Streptomyces sp. BV286]|uniref:hypothetical protein n=1 Tax=Streptomyces sp. BV286 TaxID=2849672 RepID=UPI0020C714F7|nr:hypothetical protein [Streptomyces sp. BV286]
MAHLLEVATGFRPGDPFHPGPGEPRAEYDPARRTLTERRYAKVAELAALDPQHAKLLGLGSVGYRTLIRWENARRRFGLVGCADDRWLRRSGGTRTVSEPVREAVLAVREETKRMAKVSMRTKDRMIRQYVREEFGPETKVPSYDTLRRLWQEWFGPGGARQRYARSADLPESEGHVLVHRQRPDPRIWREGRVCTPLHDDEGGARAGSVNAARTPAPNYPPPAGSGQCPVTTR